MNDSMERALIGASSGEIDVQGGRCDVLVPLDAAAVHALLSRLRAVGAGGAQARVVLCLDNIRGALDASALSVSVRLPQNVSSGGAGQPPPFRAGSVGLYGLRRASVAHAGSPGRGLAYVLDVTPFFESLSGANAAGLGTLLVSIESRRAPAASASVVIGRLRLLAEAPHG